MYFVSEIATILFIRVLLKRNSIDLNKHSFLVGKCKLIIKSKYPVLILASVMLLIWLPVLIMLYPGTAINDTWNELQQFIRAFRGDRVYLEFLYDHHPIVTTFIMGQIIVPIAELTGNWQAAFFFYVLLQAFLTCTAFSCVLVYMGRMLRIRLGFLLFYLLIYAIYPVFPASAQTICKDALFSWIFVLFTVCFIEVVRSGGQVLDRVSIRDEFLIVSLACCLTKKVGVYVIVLSLIIAAATLPRGRKRLLFAAGVCACVMMVIMPAFRGIAHISPGGKQEMFSLPFQQTARYARDHADDISDEEYAVIDRLLDMDTLAGRYDPVSADPVKGYSERGTSRDYLEYIRVWIRQGLRHPSTYWEAFCAMEAGWFSWEEYKPLMDMDWHIQLNPFLIPDETATRKGLAAEWAERYQQFYDDLYSLPVAKQLLSYGFLASLVPAFIVCTLVNETHRRRLAAKKADRSFEATDHVWLAAVPMILSIILGCWLAPLSIHFEGRRYLYPVVYTLIPLLGWCQYSMVS